MSLKKWVWSVGVVNNDSIRTCDPPDLFIKILKSADDILLYILKYISDCDENIICESTGTPVAAWISPNK